MFAATMRKRGRERHGEGSNATHNRLGPISSSARQWKWRLSGISPRLSLVFSGILVAIALTHWSRNGSGDVLAPQSPVFGDLDRRQTRGSTQTAQTPRPVPLAERYIFPRVVPFLLDAADTQKNNTHSHTAEGAPATQRRRRIKYPMSSAEPLSSRDYLSGRAEPLETDECTPNAAWQTLQYPTCNSIHEMSLAGPFHRTLNESDQASSSSSQPYELIRMVNNGFWRDVWTVVEYNLQRRVIKTLRYDHDYTPRNIERNRRDAMALERLTKSPHVVNVYGYCSTSAAFEFSNGGDINNEIWSDKNITSVRKLQIATQAAMGLVDAHTVDFEDRATIAHTDIAGNQYILIDGVFKLNDFNRARFLLRNKTSGENCPYFVGKNPGKNRSPEEYRYDPQSEKVDVYSFGNVLYTLLQREFPFQDVSTKTARQRVMSGYRPSIFVDVWNSTDAAIQAIKQAMIMCHEQNQTARATMREVEAYLKTSLEALEPGRLQEWGES